MYKILKSESFRAVINSLLPILNLLNKIVPKKKNTILFFNSKEAYLNNYAMFTYYIEHNYNDYYRIYFSMPGKKYPIFENHNVFRFSGLIKTFFVFLRTEVCYIDSSTLRINPGKGQKIINLWHGTPLKKICHMSHSVNKKLKKDSLSAFSNILVSSENFVDIYKASFNISKDKIFFAGQPRLDFLNTEKEVLSILGIEKENYKKIIIWMTTYRISKDERLIHGDMAWSETHLPVLTDIKVLSSFDKELKKLGHLVIIKMHPGSAVMQSELPDFTNIIFLKESDFISKEIQLYELVACTDALVTDYSSIYFDYLILNKPIIFVIDDYESYSKLNGFVFDNASDYMPGNKVKNYKDLLEAFTTLDIDTYIDERQRINKYVNDFEAGNNCKIIAEFSGVSLRK